jgi:hypothetical protein
MPNSCSPEQDNDSSNDDNDEPPESQDKANMSFPTLVSQPLTLDQVLS